MDCFHDVCRLFYPKHRYHFLRRGPPPPHALQVLGTGLGAVTVWSLFMTLYHMEAGQHQHALRQVGFSRGGGGVLGGVGGLGVCWLRMGLWPPAWID